MAQSHHVRLMSMTMLSLVGSCLFQRPASTCRAAVAKKSAERDLQLQLVSFVTAIFADRAQTLVVDETARDARVPVLVVEVIAGRGVGANIAPIRLFDLFRD